MNGRAALYFVENATEDAQLRTALLMRCAADFCQKRGLSVPDEGSLCRTALGKPFFNSVPAPRFSVSHSGSLWAAAFSSAEVGFDVERVRERGTRAVAARFFSEEEQKYALRTGGSAFFDIWTAKESYIKLTGQGIDENFRSISTVNENAIDGAPLGVLFVRPSGVPAGYSACLALTASAT